MRVVGFDGSTKFLVLNSQEVKTTSQDASGGSFLTGLDYLSIFWVSNMSFSFVFVPWSKEPFWMGSRLSKEFIYIIYVLKFLHPFLLAETSLCSGLSFKYSSPTQKRLVDGVHESYDEDLGPLML